MADKYNVARLVQQLAEERKLKYNGGIYYVTQIEMSYNSNRIEGSQLSKEHTRSLFETQTILSTGNEVIKKDDLVTSSNHFVAFNYILDNYDKQLDEPMIKQVQKLLVQGTADAECDWFNIGEYKKLPNEVSGMETTAPEDVSTAMGKLVAAYNEKVNKTLEDVIDFHVAFEKIHPFQDGNGRTGRLLMFKECLHYNILPFIINEKHKLFYYRGLREYASEKGFLLGTCQSAQDDYLALCKKFVPRFEG